MKITLYYDNLDFICINVLKELQLFWLNNVIMYKNKKIWLTVNVNTKSNYTFKLIDNLPFCTSEENDAQKVLEYNYKNNLLLNKTYKINSISFIYNIEKNSFYNEMYKIYFVIFLVSFTLTILALLINNIFNIESSCIIESTINNVSIDEKSYNSYSNVLINTFKITNSSCKYFPSYFAPSNFVYIREDTCMSDLGSKSSIILEKIRFLQYATINDLIKITHDHIDTLNDIKKEYSLDKK